MDPWRVLVFIGNVHAEEVYVDRMFLPHAVKKHHHLDVVVYRDGDVGVPHDGNPDTETQKRETK